MDLGGKSSFYLKRIITITTQFITFRNNVPASRKSNKPVFHSENKNNTQTRQFLRGSGNPVKQ